MEWSGDEKRIQALFSELALQDGNHAPRFERLWSRARQTKAPQFRTTSAVVMAGVLVVAACSIVAWSWYRSIESVAQQPLDIPSQTISTPIAPRLHEPEKLAVFSTTPRLESRRQRRITRHQRTVATEATLLSKWQSPTQSFMEAPSGVALRALPQLNQSVEDLKLFLSTNSEMMKESNQ